MGLFSDKSKEEKSGPTQLQDPVPAYTPSPQQLSTTAAVASTSSSPLFQTKFASLSLHMEDRLRFLNFPAPIVDLCNDSINATWKRGIQSRRPYANSFEFQLDGHPWRGMGEQATEARRLVTAVLATLHGQGWVLTLNTDVNKNLWDKDTLLFRWQSPAPAECEWGSIAFSKTNRLRFIDLPVSISRVVESRIERDLVKEHSTYMPGVEEIKLTKSLWYAQKTDTMKAREILLILLETLEEDGWSVYASIGQKNGGQNYTETDTWHLCKPKGWVNGAPVYHH